MRARKALGCVAGLAVFLVLVGIISVGAVLIEEGGILDQFPMKIATVLGLGAAAIGFGVYQKVRGPDPEPGEK